MLWVRCQQGWPLLLLLAEQPVHQQGEQEMQSFAGVERGPKGQLPQPGLRPVHCPVRARRWQGKAAACTQKSANFSSCVA